MASDCWNEFFEQLVHKASGGQASSEGHRGAEDTKTQSRDSAIKASGLQGFRASGRPTKGFRRVRQANPVDTKTRRRDSAIKPSGIHGRRASGKPIKDSGIQGFRGSRIKGSKTRRRKDAKTRKHKSKQRRRGDAKMR